MCANEKKNNIPAFDIKKEFKDLFKPSNNTGRKDMEYKKLFRTIICIWLFCCVYFVPTGGLMAEEQNITIAAVGDCIISNKISFYKDSRFLQLVDIIKQADCAYGNCETTFFKPEDGFPAYKSLDPNVFCYPWGADEIKWLGIDLMSLANNHIMDFDYNGLFATLRHLDRVGIEYAGAGKDLESASRHGIYETSKGMVALISCSSWIPEKNHQASMKSPYMAGKPGLNPLNTQMIIQLDEKSFAKLKTIKDDAFKAIGIPVPEEEKGKEVTAVTFDADKFVKGKEVGLDLEPAQKDIDRILESIRIAKRMARIVIISQHEHLGQIKEKAPTKFQETFARSCIDAGADIFLGTGSHELWGIEIYKGKPIFYSIGNFLFHAPLRVIAPEAYERIQLPADTKDPTAYEEKFMSFFSEWNVSTYESMVPVVTFDTQNKLKEIRLYPITLNEKAPWYRRGTPELADETSGKTIIQQLQDISKRYHTSIVSKKGIAHVKLQ